jgi:hypothetical protein
MRRDWPRQCPDLPPTGRLPDRGISRGAVGALQVTRAGWSRRTMRTWSRPLRACPKPGGAGPVLRPAFRIAGPGMSWHYPRCRAAR